MKGVKIYSALGPLLLEYFSNEDVIDDFESFMDWLDSKRKPKKASINAMDYQWNSIDGKIAACIGILFRFAKNDSKEVFAQSSLQSLDEFGYLAYLLQHQKCSKTFLIDMMLHEKSTGTEILKRLLMYGFVEETKNTSDGRSKLISITKKGIKEITDLLPRMSELSRSITQFLDENEKIVLCNLLEKLEIGHRNK